MHTGRIVFSQIMDFLPRKQFQKCVHRYRGTYKVKKVSCMDQFLFMAFAQLTYRESLRDIEACLRAMKGKLYHMGVSSGNIARSTLADANENRDWRIYADFAQVLIHHARDLYANEDFGVELEETVYALDSTMIELCLSLFPWAHFRRRKGAIKLHTLMDLRGNIPSFISITDGKVHDVNILDEIIPEPAAFYILDRAYIDFARLFMLNQRLAFFVTRAKRRLHFRRLYSHRIKKSSGLRSDQTIMLEGFYVFPRLSRETSPNLLLRQGQKSPPDLFNQQLLLAGAYHRSAFQMPMADRDLLQMDQTESPHQGILRDIFECGENSNLDRDLDICACRHHEKTPQSRQGSLHNITDFEPNHFRKSSSAASTYRIRTTDSRCQC